jgi:hypothetical protein
VPPCCQLFFTYSKLKFQIFESFGQRVIAGGVDLENAREPKFFQGDPGHTLAGEGGSWVGDCGAMVISEGAALAPAALGLASVFLGFVL